MAAEEAVAADSVSIFLWLSCPCAGSSQDPDRHTSLLVQSGSARVPVELESSRAASPDAPRTLTKAPPPRPTAQNKPSSVILLANSRVERLSHKRCCIRRNDLRFRINSFAKLQGISELKLSGHFGLKRCSYQPICSSAKTTPYPPKGDGHCGSRSAKRSKRSSGVS